MNMKVDDTLNDNVCVMIHLSSFCYKYVIFYLHQECSKRANNGKFTLRDLLVVPMQRVLKYHLLLQVRET